MNDRRRGLLALACVLLPTSPAHGQLPDSTTTQIDRVFTRWNRTDSPGCALGVSQSGTLVLVRAYGMSDLQHAIPITPASIFHISSISKQVTAYAVALLAEDGRLTLDDDVRRYVPELPDYGHVITIRHLIQHTSGLRDQWQLLKYAGWRDDDVITQRDVLRIVSRQQGLNFTPGAEWLYSNTGYTLLGVIIERVSGKPLRVFAHERIFAPVGMRDTHIQDDHTMIVRGRTAAYTPRDSGGWKISIPVFDTYGATSLFTTVGDLLRWMANLRQPIVGSATMAATAQRSGALSDGTPTNYGYGLTIGTYRGLKAIGHGGADAGYRAYVEQYPARGIAIAVLCNGSNTLPETLLHGVADVLIGTSVPPQRLPIDTAPRAVSASILQRWVGVYRDTLSHAVLRVRRAGDTLQLGDGRRLTMTSDSSARIGGTTTGLVSRTDTGVVTSLAQLPRTMRSVRFRREIPHARTPASLTAFTGGYHSAELDVRYEISAGDSALVMQHRKLADTRLEPAFGDVFTLPSGAVAEFTRDGGRAVSGFMLFDSRLRRVRFVRIQ